MIAAIDVELHSRALDDKMAALQLRPGAFCTGTTGYTGIPHADFNWVLGPGSIAETTAFFAARLVPFSWYMTVREPRDPFCEELTAAGFALVGTVRGLGGPLVVEQRSIPKELSDYTFERATDIDGFTKLAGLIFNIEGVALELFKQANQKLQEQGYFRHWVAKNQRGDTVSILTAFMDGDIVSFWNGATIEDERRKGLNQTLAAVAALDAKRERCTRMITYMSDPAIATRYCEKAGLQELWTYDVFCRVSAPE